MKEKYNISLGGKKHSNYPNCLGRKHIPRGNKRFKSPKLHSWHCCKKKPYSCKLRGWRTLRSGFGILCVKGQEKTFDVWSDACWTCWNFWCLQLCALIQFWSPALLQCDFCNLYVLLSVIWPCCLGCWVLIQRAIEWSSQMCCWGRAAKTSLLGHRGEGDPSARPVVILMGMSAEEKYMVIHTFPWAREKYCKSLCMVAENRAFQHLVKV